MDNRQPDIKSIFGKVLEIDSAASRAAYLDAACVGNETLRAEVESQPGWRIDIRPVFGGQKALERRGNGAVVLRVDSFHYSGSFCTAPIAHATRAGVIGSIQSSSESSSKVWSNSSTFPSPGESLVSLVTLSFAARFASAEMARSSGSPFIIPVARVGPSINSAPSRWNC